MRASVGVEPVRKGGFGSRSVERGDLRRGAALRTRCAPRESALSVRNATARARGTRLLDRRARGALGRGDGEARRVLGVEDARDRRLDCVVEARSRSVIVVTDARSCRGRRRSAALATSRPPLPDAHLAGDDDATSPRVRRIDLRQPGGNTAMRRRHARNVDSSSPNTGARQRRNCYGTRYTRACAIPALFTRKTRCAARIAVDPRQSAPVQRGSKYARCNGSLGVSRDGSHARRGPSVGGAKCSKPIMS